MLNSCGITCAGDEKEIAAFCAHVSELDLSDNRLEDWHEVKFLYCCISVNNSLYHCLRCYVCCGILVLARDSPLYVSREITDCSNCLYGDFSMHLVIADLFFINVKSAEELYSRHQEVNEAAEV